MNNISWGKTIGNWGTNSATLQERVLGTPEVEPLSPELLAEAKKELTDHCLELLQNSEKLYIMQSSKELYDAIISLELSYQALRKIYQKEISNLN